MPITADHVHVLKTDRVSSISSSVEIEYAPIAGAAVFGGLAVVVVEEFVVSEKPSPPRRTIWPVFESSANPTADRPVAGKAMETAVGGKYDHVSVAISYTTAS